MLFSETNSPADSGINMTINRFSRADMEPCCPEKAEQFWRKCTISSSEQQGIEPTEKEVLGAQAGQADGERQAGANVD